MAGNWFSNLLAPVSSSLGGHASTGGSAIDNLNSMLAGGGIRTKAQIDSEKKSRSLSFGADDKVWLGATTPHGMDSWNKGRPQISNYGQALDAWFQWSDQDRQKAMNAVSQATGKEITSFSQFNTQWKKAVGFAAQSYRATHGGKTGTLLTPWDYFSAGAGGRHGAGGGGGGGGGRRSLAGTHTTVDTSINELSDGGAWALLKAAATQSMGRAPTHEELRSFASRASQIAAKNPTVSTIKSTTDDTGNVVSRNTKTKQGADVNDFRKEAESQVDTPEAGAYQAATTYFNAMLQGLNSVV